MNDKRIIQEYTLHEFLVEVQEAILEGYTFDFTKNETYPLNLGGMYYVVMVYADPTDPEVVVVASEQQAEELMTQVSTEDELVLPEGTDAPRETEMLEGSLTFADVVAEPTPARRGRPAKDKS